MRGSLKNVRARLRAFGLPEMLIVVAVIGVIAAISMPMLGGVHNAVSSTKLRSDLKTVNAAIDTYRANGGDLAGISNYQEIVDKLKTTRKADDAVTFVGYSGSTIEKRLAVRLLSPTEAEGNAPRAVWNAAKNRFEITTSGAGIKEFYLDDALAEVDYATEERNDSALAWNAGDGWIWEYSDAKAAPPSGPEVIPTGTIPDTAPPMPPAPVQLAAPSFLPGNGTFPVVDFPLSVSISNPNPPSTWVMISTDGGATWGKFSGSVSVSPDTELMAYATGNPANWIKSGKVSAKYLAPDPDELDEPEINLSETEFSDLVTELQVSMSNPNPTGVSEIRYAIKAPGDSYPPVENWAVYSGAITVASANYPDGFLVKAYANSLDEVSWIDSEFEEEAVGASFIGVQLTGDVLLILDASSSMSRDFGGISRFEMVIQETVSAITSLPANLKFNVAMFDGATHWTDGTFQLHKATPPMKRDLIDQILQVKHGSGTNYEAGLSFPPRFSPLPQMVVFLSDGEPSSSYDYSSELQALVDMGIPVHTVGVDLNSSALRNLEEIANVTGGSVTEVTAP